MRTRVPVLALALTLAVAAAEQLTVGAPAAFAAGGDITTVCAGALSGSTYTLGADCDTTATLTVPDGLTVDGAGHEITAHDPDPAAGPSGLFLGPVVTNEGATMNLTHLTVRGTGFTSFGCNAGATPTVGVFYHNASGSMSGLKVLDITQHSTCQTVHSIQLRADTGPQTVSITGSTVAIYQRTALLVQGAVTLHASGDTFGPPDPLTPNPGGLAQNTVQIGSPAVPEPSSGTFTDNTVIGSSFGRLGAASTGMLIAGASGLSIRDNTFTGVGTDQGILFFGPNSDVTIAYNRIERTAQDRPGFEDHYGFGVDVDASSRPSTTLICNTFSGWNRNLVGITQPPCITSPAELPCVTVDEPVDLHLEAYLAEHTDLIWHLTSGELPPGLTLHRDGVITGTPTAVGTTTATIEVADPQEGTASRTFTFCVKAAPTTTPTTTPTTGTPIATSPTTYP
ncbi:right-handed parallel beta-helix repeat-containing protein, partial [Actinospica durhamensis]